MNAKFFARYGVVLALAILFIINIATRGSSFLQIENLRNLFSQSAFVGIIAIGMTIVIITGGIDLSVGSAVAMCGAMAMLVLNKFAESGATTAIALAGGAALLAGLIVGLVNGAIVAYFRVAPFIVTLAGLAGYRSIALVLGDGGEIRSKVDAFRDFGFGGLPIPGSRDASGAPVIFYYSAILFLVIALVFDFVLKRTRYGRHLVATGSNPRAAHYSAIDTKRVKLAAYAILGVLTGLAAYLLAARMNSVGTGSVGLYYELDAIAAAVIGGASLRGGKGRIWGTVCGALMLTLIANMMTAYRIDANWQGLVRGVVILIAVLLQRGSDSKD